MDAKTFAQKVFWEGGVLDALDYGLRSTDLDEEGDLKDIWVTLESLWGPMEDAVFAAEELVENLVNEDDEDEEEDE